MTAAVKERIGLPNGDVMLYSDPSHRYWLDAKPKPLPLQNVSTVSKMIDAASDNDGLLHWAAKLTVQGVHEILSDAELPETGDDLYALLAKRKLRWSDARQDARKRGTTAHEDALASLATVGMVGPDAPPEDEAGYHAAVLDWWAQRKPQATHSEQGVCSREHSFAGRFDLRCRIDGEMWLVDLKTAKRARVSMLVQLAGYELAARECGVGGSDRQMILLARPDGTWKEVESRADGGQFLACLDLLRDAKGLERTLR